jgi:hypothetical protein
MPDSTTERFCNEALILCVGQALNVGEMYTTALLCSGPAGTATGGAGASGGLVSGCPAGHKTYTGIWYIKEDEVYCGGDKLGSNSCPKGKVCQEGSGGKVMCGSGGKAESDSGSGQGAGSAAAPVTQGGASRDMAGWVGVIGAAVGGLGLLLRVERSGRAGWRASSLQCYHGMEG